MAPTKMMGIAVLLLGVTCSPMALAQGDAMQVVENTPAVGAVSVRHEPQWYGYQTLAVDALGVGVGLALAHVNTENRERMGLTTEATVATSLFVAGATLVPAVHWAHGNTTMGFASMSMRVFAPPTFGLVGALSSCTVDEFRKNCGSSGAATGFLVAQALTASIDAMLLARERDGTYAVGEDPNRRWYGYQTLAVDIAGIALGGVFIATRNESTGPNASRVTPAGNMIGSWYLVGAFGAPIVHFAHGNVGRGFIDFGLRLMVPGLMTLPSLIGYCTASWGADNCVADGAVGGLLGGMAMMTVIDALIIANVPLDAPSTPTPSSGQTSSLLVLPSFSVSKDAFSFSLVGTL